MGIDQNTYAILIAIRPMVENVTVDQAKVIDGIFEKYPDHAWNDQQKNLLRLELYKTLRPIVGAQKMVDAAKSITLLARMETPRAPRGRLWKRLLGAVNFSRYCSHMNAHRYFLYARKSTDDKARQIRSIKDQIAELRELAHRFGIVILETLQEKQTAKKPGRPVFNAMLSRIENGEADGILAWHPDRLSRNSLDSGRIIYMLDTGIIKDLRFCTQTFEPTAQGKFNLAVMFDQAKYYVDNLSENIKRGQPSTKSCTIRLKSKVKSYDLKKPTRHGSNRSGSSYLLYLKPSYE